MGSEQLGYTQGSRGCHAHYHIIMLLSVWDWTFAIRLLKALSPTDPSTSLWCFWWRWKLRDHSFISKAACFPLSPLCLIFYGLSGWTFKHFLLFVGIVSLECLKWQIYCKACQANSQVQQETACFRVIRRVTPCQLATVGRLVWSFVSAFLEYSLRIQWVKGLFLFQIMTQIFL